MSNAKASNGAQDPTPSGASDIVVPQPRINRRQVLKGGAAAATVAAGGLFGPGPLPLLRRSAAAQGGPLPFWQFYGPGGEVASQEAWFVDTVKAWNDQNDTKVELQYVPPAEYIVMAGSTVVALPTLLLFFIFQRQFVELIKTSGLE